MSQKNCVSPSRLLCSLFFLILLPLQVIAQDTTLSNVSCPAGQTYEVVSSYEMCGCSNCECGICAYCGDGLILNDEECDDGNANLTDSCRKDCKLPYCGDGVWTEEIDLVKGETCDFNDPATKAGCREDCTKCGDNKINNASEECDGTDTAAGSICRPNCKLIKCGDGVIDEVNNETCDYGIPSGQNGHVANCRTNGYQCTFCGDGKIQAGMEECDLNDMGNVTHPNATCSATCEVNPYCGDGVIGDGEQCEGTDFGDYEFPANVDRSKVSCTDTCQVKIDPYCGDGKVNVVTCDQNGGCLLSEQCDGQDFGGTGFMPEFAQYYHCTDECVITVDPYCGDGRVNGNEDCEGEDISQAYLDAHPELPLSAITCTDSCTVEVDSYCGDNKVDGDEECDGCHFASDSIHPFASCNPDTCKLNEYCGDGIVNGTEECEGTDFSGYNNTDNVPASALFCNPQKCEVIVKNYCGDGIRGDGQCLGTGQGPAYPLTNTSWIKNRDGQIEYIDDYTCKDRDWSKIAGYTICSEEETCDGNSFTEEDLAKNPDATCSDLCELEDDACGRSPDEQYYGEANCCVGLEYPEDQQGQTVDVGNHTMFSMRVCIQGYHTRENGAYGGWFYTNSLDKEGTVSTQQFIDEGIRILEAIEGVDVDGNGETLTLNNNWGWKSTFVNNAGGETSAQYRPAGWTQQLEDAFVNYNRDHDGSGKLFFGAGDGTKGIARVDAFAYNWGNDPTNQTVFDMTLHYYDKDNKRVPYQNTCEFQENVCWTCAALRLEGCFVPETKILMANGEEKAIKDIHAGEQVLNPVSGKLAKVLNVLESSETEPIIAISVGSKTVKVTQNHPVKTSEGVVVASKIKVGDLLSLNGTQAQVSDVRQLPVKSDQKVINIRLEGDDQLDNHMLLSDGIVTGDLTAQEIINKQ